MPGDETYLKYMLSYAKRVSTYIAGMSRAQFDGELKTMDAVVLQLGNIGEAASQVSAKFQSLHPEIPWPKIIGMRNRIFHRYVEIDWDIVWIAATDEVPRLIAMLEPMVPPEEKS
jgi:uncharacterized protein with HEPN domain